MTGRREEIERSDRKVAEDEKEKREKNETGRVERMQIHSEWGERENGCVFYRASQLGI